MALPGEPDEYAKYLGSGFESEYRAKAQKLKQELITQTKKDIESWQKAMEVEYANTHPDRPNDRVVGKGEGWVRKETDYGGGYVVSSESPIPQEEINQYIHTIENEYYEWVVPTFERRLTPDPCALDPMMDALTKIEGMFGGAVDEKTKTPIPRAKGLTRTADVRSDMEQWEGSFQVNFFDGFLDPLTSVEGNQSPLAKACREVLKLNKLIYVAQRKAAWELMDVALDALAELKNDKSPSSHVWATLVGITVGTILTGTGVGAVVWAGVAIISASTLAQGLTPDAKKETDITAPTAQEVANKILDALGKQSDKTSLDEQTVLKDLTSLQNAIADSRKKDGELKVPRPALSGAAADSILNGGLTPRRTPTA